MSLRTSIIPGDSGHISDHNIIHGMLNAVTTPFTVAGVTHGLLADIPVAGTRDRLYWATNRVRLYVDNGSAWEPAAALVEFNVMDYGAVGDGVADDTAAIQATLTAAAGSAVTAPPGRTFKITDLLTSTNSATVDFSGSSIHQTTTGKGALRFSGASNVTIRNTKFTGPQSAAYANAERAVEVVGASAAAPAVTVRIHDCDFDTWGGYGIYCEFVRGLSIRDNTFFDIAFTGIIARSCIGGGIRGNDIDLDNPIGTSGSAYGIAVDRRDAQSSLVTYPRSSDIVVAYNHVRNNPIWEAYDTHGGQRISFIGNTAYNVNRGIVITQSTDGGSVGSIIPIDCHAIGNILDSGVTNGTAAYGIQITGYSSGVGTPVSKATGSIVGNTVRGFGLEDDSTTGAIYMRTTEGVSIIGNQIINPSPVGILLYYDNYSVVIQGNTIIDPWSNTIDVASGALLSAGYNTVTASGNKIKRDVKSSTYPTKYGFYVNVATGSSLQLGVNGWSPGGTVGASYLVDGGAPNITSGPLQLVTFSLTPSLIANGAAWTSASQVVTAGGDARVYDTVEVYPPSALGDGVFLQAKVDGGNTVKVSFFNLSGGNNTPPSGTYGVRVLKKGAA